MSIVNFIQQNTDKYWNRTHDGIYPNLRQLNDADICEELTLTHNICLIYSLNVTRRLFYLATVVINILYQYYHVEIKQTTGYGMYAPGW